jgi:hypothetical protein
MQAALGTNYTAAVGGWSNVGSPEADAFARWDSGRLKRWIWTVRTMLSTTIVSTHGTIMMRFSFDDGGRKNHR